MMGLSDGRKSFQIALAVLKQYRRVTDTQTASHPASHVAVPKTPLILRHAGMKK